METFYNGLNTHTRMLVEASTNEALLVKSYNETYEILERISNNNYQWPTTRSSTSRKVAGIHDVDVITSLAAQVSSFSNMFKTMNMGMNQSMGKPMRAQMTLMENISCVYCSEGHSFDNCPSNPATVCYMGNQNRNGPYSNSYNPSWRQHPNFSWSNQGVDPSNSSMPPSPNFSPGYSPQAPQQRLQRQIMQSISLENMLKEYIVKNEAIIQSQAASLRNLENQVGQLANELRNRPHGTFQSDTKNPRIMGKEHYKAITLRSGKESENNKTNYVHEGMPQHCRSESSISKQPTPFSQRFQKQKLDSQFKKFLDMLKQQHINIPLIEALEKMLNHVKFMKDVLTRKRRLREFEIVALTKECSSFLQDKFPPKLKDRGSFTIPCTIGNTDCGMTLWDLGASINLMPMYIFKKLGIGEVAPTTIERCPLSLGGHFLEQEDVDVKNGELTMRVQDEKVTFNVFKAMKFPDEVEECSVVSVVDYLASKEFQTSNVDDPLERLLLFDSHNDEDEEEYLAWLEANSQGLRTRGRFDSLELSSREFKARKPPIEEPPKLELKVLSSHLQYAYLGLSSTLPFIIQWS
ncbi:uncharacterized protein LOC133832506 [Humulus lupulus]|uniref:uncharacterized protein LOC133832506 n=1 Tax=Humulus lupulus TaxID=3486 RepID=UPI002B4182D7|nr:uncharacterized protein LOC133832506 [Humulus lupulus]